MRTLRHLALALAWGCSLLGAALVLLYAQPEAQASMSWVAMAAAFIPYGIALWAAAVVLFLAGGKRWTKILAFPALVALVIQVGWARPYWPGPGSPGASGQRVSVLATNVSFGQADPAAVAAVLDEADADVIIVIEATEPFLAAPELRQPLADHPWRSGRAASGAQAHRDPSGTVVFSRLPLADLGRVPSRFEQPIVTVDAGGTPLVLVAAHPTNMLGSGQAWEHEGQLLLDAVRRHLTEPLAIVGDLNATPEHLTLRRLLDAGLVLGAQEAGAGWQPTYTALGAGPALIPIDHALTSSRVTTRTFRTIPVAGSDHWAIRVDLAYR